MHPVVKKYQKSYLVSIYMEFFVAFDRLYFNKYTVKMNTLYLINKLVATDYKKYYLLNLTN